MIFSESNLCLDGCYGVVYCLTNLRNGKRYVGICKTGRIKTRLRDHQKNLLRKQENPHLHAALNQDDFKHDIIDQANSEAELFEKEKHYIKIFRSAEDSFGYNLTIGGDGRTPYFRPYEEARAYIHSLNLPSSSAFYIWCVTNARPKDIPGNPHVTYKGIGWTTWKDFIGRGRKPRNIPWMPYQQAAEIVRPLGLREREYRQWSKKNGRLSVPLHPERVYKDKGWIGWGDYLGTRKSALQHLQERNSDPAFQKKCHTARWEKSAS